MSRRAPAVFGHAQDLAMLKIQPCSEQHQVPAGPRAEAGLVAMGSVGQKER